MTLQEGGQGREAPQQQPALKGGTEIVKPVAKISPVKLFVEQHGLEKLVGPDILAKVTKDLKGKKVDPKAFLASLERVRPELVQRVESRLQQEQNKKAVVYGEGHEKIERSQKRIIAP